MKAELLLQAFKQYLLDAGMPRPQVRNHISTARRFLKHVGESNVERISEKLAPSFFDSIKNKQTRMQYAMYVSQFLRFSAARLPVPVNARGDSSPRAQAPESKKEIALKQRWTADKLIEQKRTDDDLIAKLARKVIDGYLLSQQVIKGNPNLDDFLRYATRAGN